MELILFLLVPTLIFAAFDSGSSENSDDDNVTGSDGNDTIDGGNGDDTISGGAGDDVLRGWNGNDSLLGGEGSDLILGQNGDDTLRGDHGEDLLIGGEGNDSLRGGADDDLLIGDDGEDTLSGGLNDDVLVGYTLDEGTHPLELYDVPPEEVIVQAQAAVTDTSGADQLDGGYGDDILLLGEADTATGGEGEDLFVIRDDLKGSATVTDFTPDEDLIVLSYMGDSAPDYEISDDGDGNALVQVNGVTMMQVNGAAATLTANDIGLIGAAGEGETPLFLGDDNANTITGNGIDATYSGLGGDDTIFGTDANETILGGFGNDVVTGDRGNDHLEGGPGDDTLNGGIGHDHLLGGDGNDALDAGNTFGQDTLEGGAGDDTLSGNSRDILDGGEGDDILNVSGSNLSDSSVGSGSPGLYVGNAILDAGDGDDVLNAYIYAGGEGEGRTVVGTSPILMIGGTGADIFNIELQSGAGSSDPNLRFDGNTPDQAEGIVEISDFDPTEDMIAIEATDTLSKITITSNEDGDAIVMIGDIPGFVVNGAAGSLTLDALAITRSS